MGSNLSNHQLKIDCYLHRLLYINLMVTINQKPITDTEKIKRKEYKHNTKESHQIKRKEDKRRRTENYKNNQNNEQNGKKYIPINNYFKWTECSN